MKKVAQTLSVKTVFVLFVLLSVSGPLSGCAVVAPLLGAGGFAFAPLQYASTAYTVGEFSYEYAANDKTPGQVVEDKYNAMVSGEAFKLPEYLQAEPAGPEAPVMTAQAETPESSMDQGPALSEEARRRRIENILGKRRTQFQRLEMRRMAFLQAGQPRQALSFNQTTRTGTPNLVQATGSQVSLD
ncbi:hypothetical protein BerOc1_01585 [Pseudodesulfovibrio hydrargyri]|uniref:Uncharacterized protein n=1 Tax=Pseudodesulfovibrio hydrargyri TaxID=2125990 RepID=A0A1J5MV05_9BACT|nr:hypothetical protein [Pseudodesulfovibrio hydrargyri]OIQ49660.1 hypothetical protein BerOc1_01585 [Pseudodesulfovibrio hydrargyri]